MKKIAYKITKFMQSLLLVLIFISLLFLIMLFTIPNLGYMLLDKIDRFIISIDKNDVIAKVTYDEVINSLDTKQTFDLNNNVDKIYISYAPQKQLHSQKLKLYPNFRFQKINGVLEIPSIGVRGKIISGKSQSLMLQGFWHVNINGAWLEAGNVVIFGHRFYHLPPAHDTFFNLNKVKVGDSILIKTDLGVWVYKIYRITVISKYDTSIFRNTNTPELTLVTCHPLWTSLKRLAVHARLQTRVDFQ